MQPPRAHREPPGRRRAARVGLRAFAIAAGVWALYLCACLLHAAPAPLELRLIVPAALSYCLFVALWPELLAGALAAMWPTSGAAVGLAATLVPVSCVITSAVFADPLYTATADALRPIAHMVPDYAWLRAEFVPLAGAGPLRMVLIMPLLVAELGQAVLHFSVIDAFALLLVDVGLLLALAVAPSLAISAAVVARGARLRATVDGG